MGGCRGACCSSSQLYIIIQLSEHRRRTNDDGCCVGPALVRFLAALCSTAVMIQNRFEPCRLVASFALVLALPMPSCLVPHRGGGNYSYAYDIEAQL